MIVLVIGMHRSGTSALAGMLHSNGIIMGRDGKWYPPPMKENPKGFYENKEFRGVNDAILRDHGYRVKSFDPAVPTMDRSRVRSDTRDRMELLVQEYDRQFKDWGWKDPRTCLTLPIWLDVMEGLGIHKDRMRVLIPHRPAGDVEASMKRRGNREKEPGQFRDLAIAYHKAVLDACARRVDFKVIDYRALMFEPEAVAKLVTDFTGCAIEDTTHIDPALADRSVGVASG